MLLLWKPGAEVLPEPSWGRAVSPSNSLQPANNAWHLQATPPLQPCGCAAPGQAVARGGQWWVPEGRALAAHLSEASYPVASSLLLRETGTLSPLDCLRIGEQRLSRACCGAQQWKGRGAMYTHHSVSERCCMGCWSEAPLPGPFGALLPACEC